MEWGLEAATGGTDVKKDGGDAITLFGCGCRIDFEGVGTALSFLPFRRVGLEQLERWFFIKSLHSQSLELFIMGWRLCQDFI